MPPKSQVIQISKANLCEIIHQEIKAANEQQSQDLKAIFEQKFDELSNKQVQLEQKNMELEKEKNNFKNRVELLQTEIKSLKNEFTGQKQQISECMKWSNKNEQYSRRNNIKIHGLALGNNEDC